MTQFKDGHRNTKFFHSYVKEKSRKLRIIEITSSLKESQDIGEETVNAFNEQFKETSTCVYYFMIDCLPNILIEEKRGEMDKTLTVE